MNLSLDSLWSKVVKVRARGRCERCGRQGEHAHHIFTRRAKSTRYELANSCFLCLSCHSFAHNNPIEFKAWVEERMGEKFNALRIKHNKPEKIDEKEIQSKLKRILKQYEQYIQKERLS